MQYGKSLNAGEDRIVEHSEYTVIGVIGARLNSSRLPNKQLLDLVGEPLISRLFTRLEQIKSIEKLVLATTNDTYNAPIIDWANARRKDVFAYEGDINNLVGRVDCVVKKYDAKIITYFCGDSPLIEPTTVDNIIKDLLKNPQFDIGSLKTSPDGKPSIHEGFTVFSRSTWDEIVKYSTNSYYREHVGSATQEFQVSLRASDTVDLPVYSALNHRLSVDTYADYRFMKELYDRWYGNHTENTIVSLVWVIEQLQSDHSLQKLNSHVVQRRSGNQLINTIFVTEVCSSRGLGHLARCVILARALQEHLSASTMIVIIGEYVDIKLSANINTVWLSTHHDLQHKLYCLFDRTKINVLVIDKPSDHVNLEKVRSLDTANRLHVVAIDCLESQVNSVNLLVVPSFYLKSAYKSIDKDKLRYGWKYYVIAPHKNYGDWQCNEKIIVFTGGSDLDAFGKWLPRALDELLPIQCEVVWVQGPYAGNPELPKTRRIRWRVIKDPNNIPDLIQQCSYAVTLYGITFFEVLTYGIPSVVYVDNMEAEANILKKHKVALVVKDKSKIVIALNDLIKDNQLASTIAQNARKSIDCKGAERIVHDINKVINQ